MQQDPNIDPARLERIAKRYKRCIQGSSIVQLLNPVKNAFTGVREEAEKTSGAIPNRNSF